MYTFTMALIGSDLSKTQRGLTEDQAMSRFDEAISKAAKVIEHNDHPAVNGRVRFAQLAGAGSRRYYVQVFKDTWKV